MRTWDENKTAINQLWPSLKLTEEEKRLWHDDLSGLDQSALYDAIRNVKRTHDNPWPQLKWVLDEYREMARARSNAASPRIRPAEKLNLSIDQDEDTQLAKDFCGVIDDASPSQYEEIENKLLHEYLPKMWSRTAIRVLKYARRRLLGETEKFGRITRSGDVQSISLPEFL